MPHMFHNLTTHIFLISHSKKRICVPFGNYNKLLVFMFVCLMRQYALSLEHHKQVANGFERDFVHCIHYELQLFHERRHFL